MVFDETHVASGDSFERKRKSLRGCVVTDETPMRRRGITMALLLLSATCRRRFLPSVVASTVSPIPYTATAFENHKKEKKRHYYLQGRLGVHETLRGGGSNIFFRTVSTNNSKDNSTTTTTTTTSPTSKVQRYRFFKGLRRGVGGLLSGIGFLSSTFVSLVTDSRSIQERTREPILALQKFLKSSGVDMELSQVLNRHLAVNVGLLGRCTIPHKKSSRRRRLSTSKFSPLFWDEARRYMRCATAVYGQAMIQAAEVDARGKLDGKIGTVTREAISSHIGVPTESIVLMDVDYDGDARHLRHFVAIDHEHEKVVLSIRGTFSLQEIVVDVAGFSRDFCGGEGHSEMATMAERVWDVAGPTVTSLLQEHPNYELIVTGHSLGAGTACLLTILLQSNAQQLLPRKQKLRCFAYASPPVFTPLAHVPKAVKATTNFVHENDVVPFLSVHSVRNLFSRLRTIQDYAYTHMTRAERAKVVLGWPAPLELEKAIEKAPSVKPKKGAPCLEIPAGQTIWLREKNDDLGEYDYECWNSLPQEIHVTPNMLVDHFPSRYEHALDHLHTLDKEK